VIAEYSNVTEAVPLRFFACCGVGFNECVTTEALLAADLP